MNLWQLNGVTLGPLLALALASGALTFWHSVQSDHWHQRLLLAQDSLAEHLALQSNVNALFKQHGDALLFGDRDLGATEAELERAIAASLSRIRAIIAAEIALVGGEEAEELDLMARIEAKVGALTRTLRALSADGHLLPEAIRRAQLIAVMDDEIDARLSTRIAEALAGERAEVAQTLAEEAEFHRLIHGLVLGLSGLSVLATGLAVLAHHRGVLVPARRIMAAISRQAGGDLSEVRHPGGVVEMTEVAAVLDRLARLTRDKEDRQAETTRALEASVTARTAELSEALTQIERAEALRRRMLADVSHELRTPLTVIHGEAEVTLRNPSTEVALHREALIRVRDTSRHANAIVEDLLTIARQDSGALRLSQVSVDLAELVRQTAALLHHPFRLDLCPGPLCVTADPVRLRQCLLALLQNALRHGGNEICIRVSRDASWVRLEVEDDGPGMDDTEKAMAFDRFFRGANALEEGTGLGLPILRAIVLAHGGQVGIADRAGGGICVWFALRSDTE